MPNVYLILLIFIINNDKEVIFPRTFKLLTANNNLLNVDKSVNIKCNYLLDMIYKPFSHVIFYIWLCLHEN